MCLTTQNSYTLKLTTLLPVWPRNSLYYSWVRYLPKRKRKKKNLIIRVYLTFLSPASFGGCDSLLWHHLPPLSNSQESLLGLLECSQLSSNSPYSESVLAVFVSPFWVNRNHYSYAQCLPCSCRRCLLGHTHHTRLKESGAICPTLHCKFKQ